MNPSIYISGAIMVAFMLAAIVWSAKRVLNGTIGWKIVHSIIILSMIGGGLAVYMNQGAYGMLAGGILLGAALAVMLMDKTENRWLVAIEFLTGGLLASGILFGST